VHQSRCSNRVLIERNAANLFLHACEASQHEHDPLEYAGREFDQDESLVVIPTQVKGSKATEIQGKISQSLCMGQYFCLCLTCLLMQKITVKMTIPPANEPITTGHRVKKVKYNTTLLPFPSNCAVAYSQTWRRIFKPSIIKLAANHNDSFRTNILLEGPAIALWKVIYSESCYDAVEPDYAGCAAVIKVVSLVFVIYPVPINNLHLLYLEACDALVAWQSAMRKDSINLVVQTLLAEDIEPEQTPDVATYLLKDMQFIFEFPHHQAPVCLQFMSI